MISFNAVERAVVAPKPWPLQLALSVLFVAVAAAGRWLIDRGANGVPFASFFPFVVLASILLDLRFAVLVALSSMVAAGALFLQWSDPTLARAFLAGAYLLTAGLMIVIGQLMRKLIIDLQRKSQKYASFNAELQHRFSNTMQIVCAMARNASHADPEQFYGDLSERVRALSRANQYLGFTTSSPGSLADVVAVALQPFRTDAFRCDGPECAVDGETAMRLMMVLHELCTNAVKYGALSCPDGNVSLIWKTEPDGQIFLVWQERNGPPVKPPVQRGLGSKLLVSNGPLQRVTLSFRCEGVKCTIAFRPANSVRPEISETAATA